MTGSKNNTKRGLKALDSISVFLISTMGPKTINASIAPGVKLLAKDAAIKASADEQTDTPKAKIIKTIMEKNVC